MRKAVAILSCTAVASATLVLAAAPERETKPHAVTTTISTPSVWTNAADDRADRVLQREFEAKRLAELAKAEAAKKIPPRVKSRGSRSRSMDPAKHGAGKWYKNIWLSARALAKLRSCESGNYTRNTGNGFYGAYQFSMGTWRRLWRVWHGDPKRTYKGKEVYLADLYPHQATPADQDLATRYNFRLSGPGQWPGCSRANPGWYNL